MVCFAWWGFPQYAARCVGAFVKSTTEKVVVVATRPEVPVEGMERVCNCPVHWTEEDGLGDLGLEDLGIGGFGIGGFGIGRDERITLVVSGWAIPAFNRLADDVRKRGGRVICMNDGNYLSLFECSNVRLFDWVELVKQMVRAIVFRLKYRKLFDGFLVPGKSGRELMRFYGVPDERIAEGMYSADESLFDPDKVDVGKKEKRIVYVGQYIERKNVKRLVEAFQKAMAKDEGEQQWELHLYGSGPLKDELEQTIKQSNNPKSNNPKSNNRSIHLHDFLQPEELAAKYREARVFCLPSVEEHWGLVVHEAALSGCYLMLSNRVGAADDLLGEKNGVTFDPFGIEEMIAAFRHLAEMGEDELNTACQASIEMGRRRGLRSFVEGVRRFLG